MLTLVAKVHSRLANVLAAMSLGGVAYLLASQPLIRSDVQLSPARNVANSKWSGRRLTKGELVRAAPQFSISPSDNALVLRAPGLIDDIAQLDASADVRFFRVFEKKDWISSTIDDNGVELLARLEKLEGLNLGNSPGVTDASLSHLARMQRLRWLDIEGTSITPSGCEWLRRHLPECRIFY